MARWRGNGKATPDAASLFEAAILDAFRRGQPEKPAEAEIDPPPATISFHHAVGAAAAVTDVRRIALLTQKSRPTHQKHVGILAGAGGAEPTDPAIYLPLQHSNTLSRQRHLSFALPTIARPETRPVAAYGLAHATYRQHAYILKYRTGRNLLWQAPFAGNHLHQARLDKTP